MRWLYLLEESARALVPDQHFLIFVSESHDLARLLRLKIRTLLDRVVMIHRVATCSYFLLPRIGGAACTWIDVASWVRLTALQVQNCALVQAVLHKRSFIASIQVVQRLLLRFFVLAHRSHLRADRRAMFQTWEWPLRQNILLLLHMLQVNRFKITLIDCRNRPLLVLILLFLRILENRRRRLHHWQRLRCATSFQLRFHELMVHPLFLIVPDSLLLCLLERKVGDLSLLEHHFSFLFYLAFCCFRGASPVYHPRNMIVL